MGIAQNADIVGRMRAPSNQAQGRPGGRPIGQATLSDFSVQEKGALGLHPRPQIKHPSQGCLELGPHRDAEAPWFEREDIREQT